jgi:hypothetical protein
MNVHKSMCVSHFYEGGSRAPCEWKASAYVYAEVEVGDFPLDVPLMLAPLTFCPHAERDFWSREQIGLVTVD